MAGQKELPMAQSLNQLLLAYLPLVVFIGVAAVIGLALLLVGRSSSPTSSPTRKSFRPTSAASTPSTTRA